MYLVSCCPDSHHVQGNGIIFFAAGVPGFLSHHTVYLTWANSGGLTFIGIRYQYYPKFVIFICQFCSHLKRCFKKISYFKYLNWRVTKFTDFRILGSFELSSFILWWEVKLIIVNIYFVDQLWSWPGLWNPVLFSEIFF